MKQRKTTTRAFRIDEEVDKQLRDWAEREGVSVSFLANKALRRLVEWDLYADRFGFMSVPNEVVQKMIESLPEAEVRELGQWVGAHVYRGFTNFMFKKFDISAVLEILPKLTSKYTKAFEFEEQRDAEKTVIVLKHSRGRMYSVYYEEILHALFAIAEREIRTEPLENALVVKIANAVPVVATPSVRRSSGT